MLPRAFLNSTILTVGSGAVTVLFAAMAAYVLQRRASRLRPLVNALILAGLIVPPAVAPIIWTMQALGGIFKKSYIQRHRGLDVGGVGADRRQLLRDHQPGG